MHKRLVDRTAATAATAMIAAVAIVMLCGSMFWGPSVYAAQERVDTIDVSELRPGMKGHGMTVFRGLEPESFDVEVIGIIRRGGQLGNMVLVRVSGAAVEAAGGVAEGMSGSPVYVGGKLAGAIAYVFPGSDHFVAGVTPIADMLRMLDYPDALGAFEEVPAGARAATSLVVSGLSGRALGRLSEALERFGATVRPAASFGLGAGAGASEWVGRTGSTGSSESVSGGRPAQEIKPGSAIALQLAQGDVEITAFGTVTYVEGDKFLAFGHPVLGN
ncbi:MAG TPA: SpoIVB peptidase S55 domain-containing protein, partial [Bacillota bacterium]|nr:SpoIVB peptidase S55 domain-containing protein [Bacillota bacterium]